MAQTFVVPKDENKKITEKPREATELQTFKTNIKSDLTQESSGDDEPEAKHGGDVGNRKQFKLLLKCVCVGDFSGNWSKGVYINDYTRTMPPMEEDPGPVIGAEFHVKCLRQTCELTNTDYQVKIQIWNMSEHERFTSLCITYLKHAMGAMVFWGARSESFDIALRWRDVIKKANSDVPVVLVVDNATRSGSPVSWLGHGMVVDSRDAMDAFCIEHGFIAWFEMLSRDWESGEKSVFGQAVSRLLEEAMKTR